MSREFRVVIPSDTPKSVEAAAKTVFFHHPGLEPARLIIVTGKIKERDLSKDLAGCTLIRDKRPFNFSKRVNLGFQYAEPHDVVVMGDDVELGTAKGFEVLREEAPLRIVVPAVEGRVGPWWQKVKQTWPEVPFVSFTCLYVPREVYDIVGPLEENFPGYGYEDTDYCLRVRRAGFSCGVVGSVAIRHSVNIESHFLRDHPKDIVKMEEEARQAFLRKYRDDPLIREIRRPWKEKQECDLPSSDGAPTQESAGSS